MRADFVPVTIRPTLTAATAATAAVISVCCLGGCTNSSPFEIPEPKEVASATDKLNVVEPSNPGLKSITELSVREFMNSWKKAQNEQDFDGYETMYATRFDGVDQSNITTFHYVREQWLSKKETQFQHPFSIAVEDEKIHLLPGMATIHFTERVTDNTSTHKKIQHLPKTLVLVAEDGAIKIVREAVLANESKSSTATKKKHKILKEFFLILDNRYVVFSSADIGKKGALYVDDTTAIKPVRKENVSRKIRQMIRRKFVVGYGDGSTEIMKVTSTRAVARYAVHFGAAAHWRDNGFTEVQMGEALWDMAIQSQSVYLTGVLQKAKKGALWAYPVRPRTPEVYNAQNLDRAKVRNIKKRLRRRDEYKLLQHAFTEAGHNKKWIDYESSVFARVFKSPKGNRRFAAATITAGRGCGDFFGAMQGFYHIKKGVLYDLGYPNTFFQDHFIDNRNVLSAIDIDHDGIPEFVGKNKLMYKIDDDWFVYEIKIPQVDCPC